jgi:ABC-2 type transport system ATP-binding protein
MRIIEIQNLYKKINGRDLLINVNLIVDKPGVYGIVGKNGSGKSLLFKTIAGLFVPSRGTVKVFEEVIGKGSFPKSFGALLDSPGFLSHYSGFHNLKILSSIQNRINDKDIENVLTLVGLDFNDKGPVRKYSLGMRQRLGIAQAIMEKPKLLLLDEPMNGLDESGISDMREMILNFRRQGITILLASHNPEDISLLCDEVYKMNGGKLELNSIH